MVSAAPGRHYCIFAHPILEGWLHSDFFMSCSGCGVLWLCFYSFLIITQLGQELISLSVHPLRCGGSGECLSLLLNCNEQDSLNIRSQLYSKKSMLPNLPLIMFISSCVLAKVKWWSQKQPFLLFSYFETSPDFQKWLRVRYKERFFFFSELFKSKFPTCILSLWNIWEDVS